MFRYQRRTLGRTTLVGGSDCRPTPNFHPIRVELRPRKVIVDDGPSHVDTCSQCAGTRADPG